METNKLIKEIKKSLKNDKYYLIAIIGFLVLIFYIFLNE